MTKKNKDVYVVPYHFKEICLGDIGETQDISLKQLIDKVKECGFSETDYSNIKITADGGYYNASILCHHSKQKTEDEIKEEIENTKKKKKKDNK